MAGTPNHPISIGQRARQSESWFAALVVVAITIVSSVLMVLCSPTELSWDEADYSAGVYFPWKALWLGRGYSRHSHGPMSIYLAKLGNDFLPGSIHQIEVRLRLPIVLLSSLAIGLMYWAVRWVFGSSRLGAMVGCTLLALCVIRLQDTNVIGPHDLILAFILAIFVLGYRWREIELIGPALLLGCIFGAALITMSYAIPLALCWATAIVVAGGSWFRLDVRYFKISWLTFVAVGVAGVVALALWPPSVRHLELFNDFKSYVVYPGHPTLVRGTVYETTPKWAALYWLVTLDWPVVLSAIVVFILFIQRQAKRRFLARHLYIGVFVAFFMLTALTAHLAGSRNLLLFVGVLCVSIGALFDDAFTGRPHAAKWVAALIVILSTANLAWTMHNPNRIPELSTNGYKEFVRENSVRLGESATAIVYGDPILKFYAAQAQVPIRWDISQMNWTTRSDIELPADAKYALLSELAYRYLPANQPVQRDITSKWTVVWSFKADRTYGLRLYEKPEDSAAR